MRLPSFLRADREWAVRLRSTARSCRSEGSDDPRLSVVLEGDEAKLLDFSDKDVQSDLEDVLFEALKQS
jgi:hypothetical protein